MDRIAYAPKKQIFHIKYLIIILFIFLYFLCLTLVFINYIEPSLAGNSPLRIAADSSTYIEYAADIKSMGGILSNNVAPLITLSGNFLGPVLIMTLLNNNNVAIALFNIVLFILGYVVVVNKIRVNKALLLCLLLANPMMFFSFLSINKEIIGFFVLSLFACFLNNRENKTMLIISMILSIFVRWELTIVMALYLFMNNKYLIFNRYRIFTILLIIFGLNFIYPILSSFVDTTLTTGDLEGNTIVVLTEMQRNYKLFIAIFPKMFLNLFGTAIKWFSTFNIETEEIIINIIIGNELCTLAVVIILFCKKKISIHSNLLYFYLFYLLLFSINPFVQSRYIFPCYVLLCLELARKRQRLKVDSNNNCCKYAVTDTYHSQHSPTLRKSILNAQ